MTLQIVPNGTQVLIALRSFLINLPLLFDISSQSSVDVIRGQVNRVPEPSGPDFAVMWFIRIERIETNVDSFQLSGTVGSNSYMQPSKFTIQIDVHGPNSSDNAQIITTLFRDQYAVDSFAASGFDVTPLLADDPRQVPFINAESQFEMRWIVEAQIQANQVVSAVPQQSAIAVSINLIDVP